MILSTGSAAPTRHGLGVTSGCEKHAQFHPVSAVKRFPFDSGLLLFGTHPHQTVIPPYKSWASVTLFRSRLGARDATPEEIEMQRDRMYLSNALIATFGQTGDEWIGRTRPQLESDLVSTLLRQEGGLCEKGSNRESVKLGASPCSILFDHRCPPAAIASITFPALFADGGAEILPAGTPSSPLTIGSSSANAPGSGKQPGLATRCGTGRRDHLRLARLWPSRRSHRRPGA